MRARIVAAAITAHGDTLAAPYAEFAANEPAGFPTGWTASGSAPDRVLIDPAGHLFGAEVTIVAGSPAAFPQAAHVADGATVNALRDALVAAGLMAAS
jgi:hypothetical protein